MGDQAQGRLAVFDLDGTLLDTLGGLAEATNRALADFGYPTHPREAYRYFVGDGAAKLAERALPADRRAPEMIRRIRERFDAYYSECCLDASPPYAGVLDMLEDLRSDGVRLAVVSNKPHPFTLRMVRALLGGEFHAVLGQRDGVPPKPDPAAVFEALRLSRADAARSVFIGDSDVDVRTGKNAGLPVVGCAWGFRGEDELSRAGADCIARTPRDIVRAMRRM